MGNVLVNRCRARSDCRYNRLQEDRTNGQRALRKLVEDKTLAEVDWQALIQKADELHQMEKRKLQKSEIKWRRKQRRKSKFLRRKFSCDASVYCVNLLSDNCRSSFVVSEDSTIDAGFIIYYPNDTEVRTLDITSSSGVDHITSSSSGEAADIRQPNYGFKKAIPSPNISSRRQLRVHCSSIESSTSSSIYLLDEAMFQTTHDVATEVARILQSLESMADSSQPLDIDPRVACIRKETEPTTVLSQHGHVSEKASKPVHRLEPIDMVHMVSEYGTSSDDESSYRLDEMSPSDVQPDVSKLTDDDEVYSLTERFDVNPPQFRSAWDASYYNKSTFSKSLAPDGSNQITL